MNNDEIISRRQFFKKAVKELLLILGIYVIESSIALTTISSCDTCTMSAKERFFCKNLVCFVSDLPNNYYGNHRVTESVLLNNQPFKYYLKVKLN